VGGGYRRIAMTLLTAPLPPSPFDSMSHADGMGHGEGAAGSPHRQQGDNSTSTRPHGFVENAAASPAPPPGAQIEIMGGPKEWRPRFEALFDHATLPAEYGGGLHIPGGVVRQR